MINHRKDFPTFEILKNGKPIIYLDNTATSLKPQQVIDAMNYYYINCCANVHRGIHKMSEEASNLYEGSREKVAGFINASPQEIIFTRNATESINLVAKCLFNDEFFANGDEVLISNMEHHSNMLPWQGLKGINVKFVDDNDFVLDIEDLKRKINSKTKLVAVAHAANTTGAINDIKEIIEIAHDNGSIVVIDSAQGIPKIQTDFKKIDADFMAFSAHKMLGPTGVGVLAAKYDIIKKMPPFLLGGGTIKTVSYSAFSLAECPSRYEAGTPNVAGVIGFGAAIDYLRNVGMDNIHAHEQELLRFASNKLKNIGDITVYGPSNLGKKVGIILFDVEGMDCHDVAYAMDQTNNIAIRSGMHCAQPFVSRFNPNGLARASFYFYNTKEEIKIFIDTLDELSRSFSR